ncbi:MAG: M81 family metallopeptidase [Candidatus Poribacteria bacterium]|nr:M81 family metallopeptidase [Candidatus Poribacteria bacterium]MDE0503637.1 M81 family metallopeptidase [Candidatus Poribacteria bacterium]
MRIATGCIGHETNTFSPVPTTIDSFSRMVGDDILKHFGHTRTITGGIIDAADELRVDLVPLLWSFATPARRVEQDAYETLKSEFLNLLSGAGEIDGMALDLHGAMVTEEIEDAEADLISSVREIVGSRPIVVTFDLHANITPDTVKHPDVIIGFDTYPHVDTYERGVEALEILHKTVLGEIRPTMAYRQLPLLMSPPAQCTMRQPASDLVKKLHSLESEEGVVTATLSMGFPFADIQNAGVSVLVTTDGNRELAERKVDEFARHIWSIRETFRMNLVSIEEAIEYANQSAGQPIVLAEGADNPGGGGPCDGTFILRAFVEAGVQDAVVAIIADPESVARAIAAGVGNRVTLNVGGKTDDMHGEPLALDAYVKTISDGVYVRKGPMARGAIDRMGRTAVIKIGGVEVILTEERSQPLDAEVLRSVGIEPKDRKLIALKSAVHYRADYTPIAHEILEVDTPGVHSPNLTNFRYEKLRRPIYPLDPMTEMVDM